jgi:hypothetical protein
MGTDKDYPVLSDKSKAALAKLGVVGAGIPPVIAERSGRCSHAAA